MPSVEKTNPRMRQKMKTSSGQENKSKDQLEGENTSSVVPDAFEKSWQGSSAAEFTGQQHSGGAGHGNEFEDNTKEDDASSWPGDTFEKSPRGYTSSGHTMLFDQGWQRNTMCISTPKESLPKYKRGQGSPRSAKKPRMRLRQPAKRAKYALRKLLSSPVNRTPAAKNSRTKSSLSDHRVQRDFGARLAEGFGATNPVCVNKEAHGEIPFATNIVV
ncbi:MAG: hypothetical protein Q9174_003096 [Haloplaca sp. 1 TL-2023]